MKEAMLAVAMLVAAVSFGAECDCTGSAYELAPYSVEQADGVELPDYINQDDGKDFYDEENDGTESDSDAIFS